MGIRGKLFFVVAGLLIAALLAVDLLVARSVERTITAQLERAATQHAALLVQDAQRQLAPPNGAAMDWDGWADARQAAGRVTVVGADGRLWGDSELTTAELATTDLHHTRSEIVAALAGKVGRAVRRSQTLGLPFLYVAAPVVDAQAHVAAVVRVATPMTDVSAAVRSARRTVWFATLAVLVAAMILVSSVAHWLTRDVRALTATARAMAAGDLSQRSRVRSHDEVAQLGRALDQLASSLQTAWGAVRAERDTFASVLDGMREGVLLVGRDDKIVLANPALRQMLLLDDPRGRTPLEMIRSAELRHVIDGAAVSDTPLTAEIELGDLKPRRMYVHARRLEAAPGGVLVVFVDVTELRQLESLRKDFVANVSHELRTPIAAVRSGAETIRATLHRDPAAADEFAQMVERNAERLQRLVDDLLELSRIEARELRLTNQSVTLRGSIESAIGVLADKALAAGVRIQVDVEPALAVRADPRALEQVLLNLVENAIKYGGPGREVRVTAALEEEGNVTLCVIDQGPGIEARHLPRLFERFYRVDAGRSRDAGGTGLGLAIVKHLVEAMGGRVTVQSAVGEGSSFCLTLPRAA